MTNNKKRKTKQYCVTLTLIQGLECGSHQSLRENKSYRTINIMAKSIEVREGYSSILSGTLSILLVVPCYC